ncbi:nucleotidyltransferase [Variovorax paradoxus]|uniref:nucleotidyltransferase n=1 Tax=Variovorax paradoxus TaxID=34073 RepID=UPI000AC0DEFB|nr:nucleotidyltransferase [Variovorax paradoxus]
MSTQFYAFGSICRGEVDRSSDIDLLACVSGNAPNIDPAKFSIYQHDRLVALWKEGNPFAWHLHLESRLLYSSAGEDFLASLGVPAPYNGAKEDCKKFARLFAESATQLSATRINSTFNLSCMFLATRNFATCFSLSYGQPIFSRQSPLMISWPLVIDTQTFDVLMRARVLSTRGVGEVLRESEVTQVLEAVPLVSRWMSNLLEKVNA